MECINCGIHFDSYKFGNRCCDCLYVHEQLAPEPIWIDMSVLPQASDIDPFLGPLQFMSSSSTNVSIDTTNWTYQIGIDPYR